MSGIKRYPLPFFQPCTDRNWDDMCTQKYGRIINITSVAGVMGGFGQTSYASAKAGLIGL